MKFDLNYEVLKNIVKVDSPTGFTKNCIDYIDNYLKGLGYNPYRNQKGNLIVEVKGQSNYIKGLSAHIDTLGLIVRSINPNGTLKFTTLGGCLLNTYNAEYCKIYTRSGKVYTGTVLSNAPAVHVYPNARSIELNEDNMCVKLDEVVYCKADTKALGIETGDIIAIDPKFEITDSGYVKTRFLDDKASSFIQLELLRYMKEFNIVPHDNVTFVFSTYEEIGHGGSNMPPMNELLALDMGCIGLDLNCTEEDVSICVKDASGPYDYGMITELVELAKKNNLKYVLDVYPMYSSDASTALRAGNDIKAALIGPGIAASHGMERTHKHAIENAFKLVCAYLNI